MNASGTHWRTPGCIIYRTIAIDGKQFFCNWIRNPIKTLCLEKNMTNRGPGVFRVTARSCFFPRKVTQFSWEISTRGATVTVWKPSGALARSLLENLYLHGCILIYIYINIHIIIYIYIIHIRWVYNFMPPTKHLWGMGYRYTRGRQSLITDWKAHGSPHTFFDGTICRHRQ